MAYENILLAKDGRVATITINRPDKMNALNHQTLSELAHAFDAVQADDSVGALILTGSGEKAFVAGADIKELLDVAGNDTGAAELAGFGQSVFRRLDELGKPSVAMINGFALGGGCELALACTLRTASSKARLGLPEVSLGIIPGYGGSQRLARIAGPGIAREWILTGDMFGAEEAHRMGVVNRVFEPEGLLEGTMKLVNAMLSKGPIALRFGMEAVLRGWDMDQAAGEAMETDYFGKAALTEDMREGMAAFLEKRKANFTGK
ncbi:MAG: enoyl-CoA hydratase/isomerase family protein [Planctomycetes bacterium]|nr:enoyl-CoA hydratase/isomerase family protein [Planctomycetota bacterium]HPF14947.1 enoyl-CoA hydratase-related protein [Planctomycetota bacterium]